MDIQDVPATIVIIGAVGYIIVSLLCEIAALKVTITVLKDELA